MRMKVKLGNIIRKRAGIENNLGKRIKHEEEHGKEDRIDVGKRRLDIGRSEKRVKK
jgi:hypothetical protein